MAFIWTSDNGGFRAAQYTSEADLENAIILVQRDLFGSDRIYLDVKRKIGVRGVQENIPDGYLLDLAGTKPRLYVVENELAVHEPLRHIAVQILQFSLAFEAEPRKVREVLLDTINAQASAKGACEAYAATRGFRNLDHLLDHLVHEVPFSALVIIDELVDNLENVLAEKFRFPVEVIELVRYQNGSGQHIYKFEPFLSELSEGLRSPGGGPVSESAAIDVVEIDTVVVPARKDGFEEVFLGEERWYAIRLGAALRPQIRYIAAYQVAPESAITHLATVKSIEPWKDGGKFVVNFAEPAKKIGPVRLGPGGRVTAPQSIRYTSLGRLAAAKTLDDVW